MRFSAQLMSCQACKPAKEDHHPPVMIRAGSDQLGRHIGGDEVAPVPHGRRVADVNEGVRGDEFPASGSPENCLRKPEAFQDRHRSERGAAEVLEIVVGVPGRDVH